MEKVDITIIGAGIIGLAAAYKLSDLGKEILVVEKNKFIGQETSSRNSEVIHAGIYYPPRSLKALCCIEGKRLLYDLCRENAIAHKQLGKILIACDKKETTKLQSIEKNAQDSGVTNLSFVEKSDLKRMEPDIHAENALWCPDTGILDSHGVMTFFKNYAQSRGCEIALGIEVVSIKKDENYYQVTVKEPEGKHFSFQTKAIINAAGFTSDKIAQMAGLDIDALGYRIHLCKGQYFRIAHPQKFRISHLIYPPPSSTDLGIHITPDLAGGLRLGPDAQYVEDVSYNVNESDKKLFHQSVGRFLQNLDRNDLTPDTAGIRPKLQGESDPFRDFVIKDENENGLENFINLIGIESPGLTACLSIAERVKTLLPLADI